MAEFKRDFLFEIIDEDSLGHRGLGDGCSRHATMTDISLMAFCRYFKGEGRNPFDVLQQEGRAKGIANPLLQDAAMLWFYESVWCRDTLADSRNLSVCTEEYIAYGLEDFRRGDGTPISLKALLFNRYAKGAYSLRDAVGPFKKWYREIYVNGIHQIYLPLPPIPAEYCPSPSEVERYIGIWNGLANYVDQERALDKLFLELCPNNKCIEDILVKCSALNDFYSTNIFDIHSVARHILELDIDERLLRGDCSLVDDIARSRVGYNREQHFFYSFATKYCSHHQPLKYAIFDNYVEKILAHFQRRDGFGHFRRGDLKDYATYMQAIADFQAFYGLQAFDVKQLDRYLWQLGKHHYMKRKYVAERDTSPVSR